jgi:hypothetical protein
MDVVGVVEGQRAVPVVPEGDGRMELSARPQCADVFLVVKEVGVMEAFLLTVGQAFGEDVAGALRGQLADQGVLAWPSFSKESLHWMVGSTTPCRFL